MIPSVNEGKGEISHIEMSLCVNTLGGLDEFEIRFRIINIGSTVIRRGGRISGCRKHVCPRLL